MTAKWLFKSDPEHYSFADLERDKQTVWDGISNNLALKYLRMAHPGDLAFIYHTGDEKSVVGMAEIVSEPYPDPKQKNAKLAVVDIKSRGALPRPVALEEIKKQPSLRDFYLVRLPRLSVMPVTEAQWKIVMKLAAGRG
ncbi:MAG TPA: EVE domain-containing protein [Terriglobia bacterium]|nr:EVE domain-containing protein [Terriglobia bacterium]